MLKKSSGYLEGHNNAGRLPAICSNTASIMQTLHLQASNPSDIAKAADLLRAGELVAVPTETVYGLAADARNPFAVEKIFVAKNRPNHHPLIVHIASAAKLSEWATDISDDALALAKAFWPGALTLLLHKLPEVESVVTGGLRTIGLRVPAHDIMRELLEKMDTGLAAPSANPHKKISPTSAAHVLSGLDGRISAVLDGGSCSIGVESTIVDCTTETPRILRAGPITQAMLEDVLQKKIELPHQHEVSVAGNMRAHYQPEAPVFILPLPVLLAALTSQDAVLYYSDIAALHHHPLRQQLPANKAGYAAKLYAALHDLDALSPGKILIEQPPASSEWLDVCDRLSKAAASS